jgi:uncharacterized protein DUF4157
MPVREAASGTREGGGARSEANAASAAATPGKTTQVERVDRNASGPSTADPDAAVASTAGSTGAPLPSGSRTQFEASLGTDLSAVRVHTGAASATAASQLGARAFAVGHDIHFGAGQYRPSDLFGSHLLAHEVAHTVQQGSGGGGPQAKLEVSQPGDAFEVEADRAADAMTRGAPATVSRGATGIARAAWNAAYGSQDPATATDDGSGNKTTLSASAYKDKINTPGGPTLKPASDPANTGGKAVHKSKFRMTKDELMEVLEAAQGKQALQYMLGQGSLPVPDDNRKHAEGELAKYMQYCERAFDTMMIDTIEAQALFIAHGAGETAFAKMQEGQTKDTSFESAPTKQKVSGSTAATTGEKYNDGVAIMDGPMRYGQAENGYRDGVDPAHAIDGSQAGFDKTFIGRGAIQATFKTSYVQAIEFMVKRAEDLRTQAAGMPDGPDKTDALNKASELDAAADAIKAEPRNAADPKYAFLFSAAYMQMSPMVKSSAGGFTNSGMTGGYSDRQGGKKQAAYAKAVEILKRHAAEDAAKDADAQGANPPPGCMPGPVEL